MGKIDGETEATSPVEGEVAITIEIKRHGVPVEILKVECEGELSHRELAPKLAGLLALEAEELIAEFSHDPEAYDPGKRRGSLRLVCVDLRFESESATHHFLARSTWGHVFLWGTRRFRIAASAAANLEMRDGSPDGPVLNESKHIGHHEGCRTVWLVKPGPEPNGR
jgi:hypothetical protein